MTSGSWTSSMSWWRRPMRPERLEMMGFAPFRSRTEVDFAGLELFALTGPTGAGKSSVIDAMTFALYGSAPRYDRKSVEPVISLGSAEARVAFDFEVEGVRHTAARVVRRTSSGGATTAEARLEREGATLASGAAEVTRAVESLLGLGIDHFTRSVVLPQGEFAAFLHDTPSGQQDLVKALLDMGVLEEVRKSAAERSRTAGALAQSARVRLEHMSDADEEAETSVTKRLAGLERLAEPVSEGEEAIAEAEGTRRQVTGRLETLRDRCRLLGEVEAPPDVTELSRQLSEVRSGAEAAAALLVEVEKEHESVSEESRRHPTAASLEEAARTVTQLERARARAGSFDLEALQQELEAASAVLEAAELARRQAHAARDEARRRHAAHALVQGHRAGDPCPVCRVPLAGDPPEVPPDLASSEQTATVRSQEHEEASTRRHRAETALAEARAGHEAAMESVTELELRAVELPPAGELDELVAARAEIDQRLERIRLGVKETRQQEAEARRLARELEESAAAGWETYASQRDQVAPLNPPPAEREDLEQAWTALMVWVDEEGRRLEEEVVAVTAAAEEAQSTTAKLREELEHLLAENDVGGTGTPSARLAAATATAQAELARVKERRAERESLVADVARFDESAQVAGALANHLKANRFEGWLLAEALDTLVEGANSLLADLTGGSYSLALRDRMIEVVDHRNADERRSVRSLSGGETFLVSLALALSLGEQLVTMSDRSGVRLEAIFLDEGFGTLDAETLETVSVVVSELAAGGRVVGLVTHVKDLADQIPVRFEVRSGPAGSTIERVEG